MDPKKKSLVLGEGTQKPKNLKLVKMGSNIGQSITETQLDEV